MHISENTLKTIDAANEKVVSIYGYNCSQIKNDIEKLKKTLSVEVGYRSGCGRTDLTHKAFREWLKVIKSLRKDGNIIEEKNITHTNKSPTMSQGYWNSIVYVLVC